MAWLSCYFILFLELWSRKVKSTFVYINTWERFEGGKFSTWERREIFIWTEKGALLFEGRKFSCFSSCREKIMFSQGLFLTEEKALFFFFFSVVLTHSVWLLYIYIFFYHINYHRVLYFFLLWMILMKNCSF